MRRIAVVGTSGAGKTTLARALAACLSVPHIELDALYWGPNWAACARDVFRERVGVAVAAPEWASDGNYSGVRDLVWTRADTLVWLDYPMGLVFRRVLWRTLARSMKRQTLWNGNRESLALSFLSRDSILLWVLTTWRVHRREYAKVVALPEHRHLRVLRFRSPREADAWLRELSAPGRRGKG